MNFFKNLNLQSKKQILACLMLSTSLVYANNNSINDSNDKSNTAKISNSNEKPDKAVDKKKNVSSSSRYHDIMATKGDCSASCCSNKSTTTKVENSNNQKSKKKFGWFFRSK